ncbi:MAG: DNA polymerase III subunit chi [Gammaproteobacteria bacterium]
MTRVDFYVLPDGSDEGPLPTACRLCEKAVGSGKRVHVHAPDDEVAREFDRLLWVYKQGGFIGHERVGASGDPAPATVLIGGAEPLPSHQAQKFDVLVNLGAEVPAFYERFERVLEIVAGDAATRRRSRARFKFYRDRGLTPESHKL